MEFNVDFEKDELRKAYKAHQDMLFWRTMARAGIFLVVLLLLWRYLA